jgi:hypothetical protein
MDIACNGSNTYGRSIEQSARKTQTIHIVGHMLMEWLRNKTIERYCALRAHGLLSETDEQIQLIAVQTARKIQRGLFDKTKEGDYDFPSNTVKLFDMTRF